MQGTLNFTKKESIEKALAARSLRACITLIAGFEAGPTVALLCKRLQPKRTGGVAVAMDCKSAAKNPFLDVGFHEIHIHQSSPSQELVPKQLSLAYCKPARSRDTGGWSGLGV